MGGGANFQSNSDLIIAKEDLASIPEKHQESQNESVSTLVDKVGSVLDYHQKRKLIFFNILKF